MEIKLRGIAASPGVAIGPAYPFQAHTFDIPRHEITDVASEQARLDEAFELARQALTQLHKQTQEELGDHHASIFHSHIDMLDDVAFKPEIKRRLADEKINVEALVDDLINSYIKMMEQITDPMFRERSKDFVDIGKRVLSHLLGDDRETLENLEHPSIIAAHDLSPSETANMDMTNTLGIASDEGGPTSHMAILARAFEIPSVVGLQYVSKRVSHNDMMIVDGTNGYVILRPSKSTLRYYEREKSRFEADRLTLVQASTGGLCSTQDGTEIATYANIEFLQETQRKRLKHSQGVGLYRTEFLFMNREKLPNEEEQFNTYRKVIEAVNPLPITMRTLDLGGDKVIPYMQLDYETNPQLGWRSIRLCLDRPDIFKAQLRAMLRASVYGDIKIMFPMITGIDQFQEAKRTVEEVKNDLRARGIDFAPDIPIGTMIEVPAAVMIADKLAEECDFFSLGTNDLIQYCLAVDRVNPRTAHLYQPTHMAVLRMIKQTIDAAHKADIPCSICGEMAGDPMLTELLLGIGVRHFSMSSVSLPIIRAEIANTSIPKAKRLAKKILNMGSVSDITALLEKRHLSRDTLNLVRQKQARQKD